MSKVPPAPLEVELPAQPKLQPHDIPAMTVERSEWSIEAAAVAIEALLSHRVCAVHVRGFLSESECAEVESALGSSNSFSNWQLHEGATSEVDKTGATSAEAMESFESFRAYAHTAAATDGLVPGRLSPFEVLRRQLDMAHPDGCCRSGFGPGMQSHQISPDLTRSPHTSPDPTPRLTSPWPPLSRSHRPPHTRPRLPSSSYFPW